MKESDRVIIRDRYTGAEFQVIGTGPRSYVWASRDKCVATLSGKVTLRKLADAIYAALGERR